MIKKNLTKKTIVITKAGLVESLPLGSSSRLVGEGHRPCHR